MIFIPWTLNLTLNFLETVDPFPETVRYTEFLIATARGLDLGQILAAMAPCMRLYAYLGQAMAKDGIPNHRYRTWIETYASDEFEALAALLETQLDAKTANEAAERAAYRTAMECELAFFGAPLRA